MLDIDDLSVAEVEEILLQNLGRQITGQLGVGAHGIVREVREKCRQEVPQHIVVEAIWGLISRGMVFLDFTTDNSVHPNPSHWTLRPTRRGWQYAHGLPNPDLSDRYLQRFASDVPGASKTVRDYLTEALNAYGAHLYIASAVMLGVAAEPHSWRWRSHSTHICRQLRQRNFAASSTTPGVSTARKSTSSANASKCEGRISIPSWAIRSTCN